MQWLDLGHIKDIFPPANESLATSKYDIYYRGFSPLITRNLFQVVTLGLFYIIFFQTN